MTAHPAAAELDYGQIGVGDVLLGVRQRLETLEDVVQRLFFERVAQFFQPHALRVEHPKQVVIWLEQQLGGVAEGLVERKPGRVGMPVRADDRQVPDARIKLARDAADFLVRRKQTVFVQR